MDGSTDSNGLKVLNDLTKPATELVNRIAEATGVLFEPRRIVRRAKAEAEAKIINAKADIEITDLQKRAMTRFIQEEGRKQQNMEDIIEQAIPLLNENPKTEEVEQDWLVNFFDKCRLVSDEDMKMVWSKILAGENNEPHSFSKRTVNLLASLDKSDAELFANLCNFAVTVEEFFVLIYDTKEPLYQSEAIYFHTLKNLQAIGLIYIEGAIGGYALNPHTEVFTVEYFEEKLIIDRSLNSEDFSLGRVVFTTSGQELCRICERKPVEGFIDYLVDNWVNKQQFRVYSPLE